MTIDRPGADRDRRLGARTVLDRARCRGTSVAPPRDMSPPPPMLSALDAIYQRRATRAFTAAQVDRTVITTLLAAAVHAPTAMHEEPWEFVVVQDRVRLAQISDRAKAIFVGARPAEAAALAKTPSRHPAPLEDPAFNIFYNAGTLIVICGRPIGAFVAPDCWLAAENLMIAATALGYATCPIGFALPALADPVIKGELGIPHDVTAYAPIIVGVAREPAAPQHRRDPVILSWS